VFNANLSSISAISWREQIVYIRHPQDPKKYEMRQHSTDLDKIVELNRIGWLETNLICTYK
jgi:hypothetical protein